MSSELFFRYDANSFASDAQVESNLFSCNSSVEYVPIIGEVAVEDVNNEEEEKEEEDEEQDGYHQRTLFEFLESDFVYESEAKDPVFNSIHTAVQMSLNGLRPDAPSTPPRQHPPIFECTPNKDKELNAHRSAEDMKEFAINLSPHTFMVLLSYAVNSNAILTTHLVLCRLCRVGFVTKSAVSNNKPVSRFRPWLKLLLFRQTIGEKLGIFHRRTLNARKRT